MENKKINYINILMALLVQVGITLLAVSLFSITMNLMDIDYKYSPVFGSVAVALGAFANAYFLSRKKKSKGYALGGAVGLITFIIITLIGLIINDGGMTVNTIFHLIIIMLSSLTGGILGVNKKSKKYV
ncbi:MAG: TIGR04086 family membrane protein [Clostridia bacterium]|nr:TIGR04086 family membrane protein [Clostridia bacterium]